LTKNAYPRFKMSTFEVLAFPSGIKVGSFILLCNTFTLIKPLMQLKKNKEARIIIPHKQQQQYHKPHSSHGLPIYSWGNNARTKKNQVSSLRLPIYSGDACLYCIKKKSTFNLIRKKIMNTIFQNFLKNLEFKLTFSY